jgi:uncharacterized membrane protein
MTKDERHPLVRDVDEKQISEAIKAAEQGTTGKIYVTLSPHFWGAAQLGAHHAFRKLRGAHPMDENGVLFFIVPSREELHVMGGTGIHQKVGQAFWDQVAHDVAAQIKEGGLTAGILRGVNLAGQALAEHYPQKL